MSEAVLLSREFVMEDGQQILKETYQLPTALEYIKMTFIVPETVCPSEDMHDFDSTGQCRTCKSFRRPK